MHEGGYDFDLLVIGAGMAGLSAAAMAARQGARVLVAEKAAQSGGNAALAGYIWTARSPEVMREVIPDGDPALGAMLASGLDPALEWVRSLGVHVGPEVALMGFGRGRQVDMASYLRNCQRSVADAGGEIWTSCQTEKLEAGEGAVVGAQVSVGGETRGVRARWTLLASGGFQNDRELTARHIHPQAAGILRRCVPSSSGDGLRLATAVGAQVGKPGGGFYGHLVPHPVQPWEPSLFVNLTLYFSEHGLLLNRAGRRFVDETVGDHLNTQAVVEQPGARALLIVDERVRRDWVVTSYVEGIEPMDKFAAIRQHGGRVAVAESLEELEYLPEEWGYDASAALATVLEYNRLAASDPGSLHPGRVKDPLPIDQPPFYILDTQPAMTFTQVGVLVDTSARVLGVEGHPVPGLLAAGADTGGTFVRGYAGGLAMALVLGLKAAETALAPLPAAAGGA
ncbi:MAG TPA: FAD-dependent oxidoreductase [Candidatus Dormibacteraeota bacterium]